MFMKDFNLTHFASVPVLEFLSYTTPSKPFSFCNNISSTRFTSTHLYKTPCCTRFTTHISQNRHPCCKVNNTILASTFTTLISLKRHPCCKFITQISPKRHPCYCKIYNTHVSKKLPLLLVL